MYGYIYQTTNLIDGKIYIGQHKWKYEQIDTNYIGSGLHLKHAVHKYGRKNFSCKILEYCESQEELDNKEKHWIKELDATNSSIGYNIRAGGHVDANAVSLGVKHYYDSLTEEQKLQYRLRVMGSKNGMYGRHHSEKTKQLWKERHRNEYKHSEETKQKQRNALLGRKFSAETLKLMSQNHSDISGEKNPMYGKHWIFCNNGIVEKRVPTAEDMPDGFILGRKPTAVVNRKWFNNGDIETLAVECPLGFRKGRLPRQRKSTIKNNIKEKII